ncbi:MAG TPA: primosomal protein N', partial [Exilispira sp.]|nr:primosomal protein N' [Exilispira sp.]
KRFNNLPLPTVELVNLTSAEKYQDFYISKRIIEAISERLERKQKVIIFLNRRGFNSFIQCRDCGLVLYCDSCSIPLTYHNANHKLHCHYCGIEKEMVTECPDCHSKNLKYLGLGTEKVEQIIQNYFQNYKIARFDADSVKESNYDEILNNFKNGDTDILIGTQMITKGHHFPDVNLVCVINADILLNMPDFRANEKTFQTLVQVSGRAGRTYEIGHVIIQTLRPTHYAIECVVNQDYESFIDKELKVRKSLNYPPFVRMLRILIKGKEEQRALVASKKLLFSIQQFILQMNLKGKVIILGPSKAPIEKIESSYRYHIILKSHNRGVLIDIGNYLNDNYKVDSHLNIEFDIDPVSLL